MSKNILDYLARLPQFLVLLPATGRAPVYSLHEQLRRQGAEKYDGYSRASHDDRNFMVDVMLKI